MSTPERQFFHDLLNPLTVVKAKAARLKKKLNKDDLPQETLSADLDKILEATERTIELIQERRAKVIASE